MTFAEIGDLTLDQLRFLLGAKQDPQGPTDGLTPAQRAQFSAFDAVCCRHSMAPEDLVAADLAALVRYVARVIGPAPIDPNTLLNAARAYAAHKAQNPDQPE